MKKIILSTAVLTFFSISIILFQISCQKESKAQTSTYSLIPATTTTLGGVIVGSGLSVTTNGVLSVNAPATSLIQLNKLLIFDGLNYALINYDGSGKSIIPITLPAGRAFRGTTPHGVLSPDGAKLFFEAYGTIGTTWYYYIYSCALNGTNLTVVLTSTDANIGLMSAY